MRGVRSHCSAVCLTSLIVYLVIAVLSSFAPVRALRPDDQAAGAAYSSWRRLVSFFGRLGPGVFSSLAASPDEFRQPEAPSQRHPKLVSQLADLAEAVTQEHGAIGIGRSLAEAPTSSRESLPKSVRDALHGHTMRLNERGEVQVYIRLDRVTEEKLRQLRQDGVTVQLQDSTGSRLQAFVPPSRLQAVSEEPFVRYVRLPSYAVHHTGSVETEGDSILRADQVRSQFGVTGKGVRVGVISDGIKGIFATGCTANCSAAPGSPITSEDLPSATGIRDSKGRLISVSGGITAKSFISPLSSGAAPDLEGQDVLPSPCAFAGAGAEGTALLEIVHDVAPDAQLAFANAATDIEFNNAVNFLASSADVVMDDFGFFGLPYNGTSDVSSNTAAALNGGGNSIRAYFTATGNESQEHYLGQYTDSGVDGSAIVGAAGHLHLFQATSITSDTLALGPQAYDLIELPATGEVVIFLVWDDPFRASTNDYNLYLVSEATGKVVASSTSVQNGTQDPVEFIDYVDNLSGTLANPDRFHVIIQDVANRAAPKNLNLYLFAPECAPFGPLRVNPPNHARHNYNTPSSSVPAESDAGGSPVSVVSVGAICSGSSIAAPLVPDTCNNPNHDAIEFFSSNGPTVDGRLKPDVSAIDGVSVTGAGGFGSPFFGTSAATPHAAGVAALLLQSAPCLLTGSNGARDSATARSSLHSLILNNAVDLGVAGPDEVFGYGRIDALASARQALPSASGATSSVLVNGNSASGASVTAAQIGFIDPDSCPLSLTFSGGCGSGSGAAMNCPFGTSSVSVSATNNGITMSSPAKLQITVTSFAVSAAVASPGSNAVTAGQPATYTVTVAPQIGSFNSPVNLICSNLPAFSSCAFNSSSVVPGRTPVSTSLRISTTARASLPGPLGRFLDGVPAPGQLQVRFVALLLILEAAGAVLAWLVRARRPLLLFAVLTLVLAVVTVACGGTSGSSPASGTPAGMYQISVTGTSGSLAQSATVSLTVQ